MKEAIVHAGPIVEIIDSPIPKPDKDQVLIKVVYSGSNPKDWKSPVWFGKKGEINQGDDIAGVVQEVGENVLEFKKGDRVAAFHELRAPHGSYAEYAISWKYTTFHLPENTSFEQGAAIPLAALTAAVGLYKRLHLPQPWAPAADGTRTPVLVYGGSSAVGTYVLQFARKSNIHPLIVVAGRASSHVEKFIDRSKGDTIIDYRQSNEALQQGIKDALKGEKLLHVFDAVAEGDSLPNVAAVADPHGLATFVLPYDHFKGFPDTLETSFTMVGDVHHGLKDLGFVYSQYISRGLDEGWFMSQPHEVIPGGLAGVEQGLKNLQSGKASAVKYVFKIADTPGAGNDA